MAVTSNFKRVQQWNVMSRLWYLYDCKWQNPFDSADKIAMYLSGQHKPIYAALSDVGDHVVAINTKDIAMPNDEWINRVYFHHTGYPGGASWTLAWELHAKNPTMVMYKAVYKRLGRNLLRRQFMPRLHLYPDDKVPKEVLENLCGQIRPLRPVPKRLTEFSKKEIDEYPKLFDWPKDYVID
ncbi:54S ribosomal protein L13 [Chamberlinius hualienensis]